MKTTTSFKHAAAGCFILAFTVAILTGCVKDIKPLPAQTESDAAANAAALAADTTPPTVDFIFPADGDTVFGTITIQVSATDNVGVTSVQCKGDGKTFGTKTASPYNFPGNTRAVMNGRHLLQAKAVDAAGNSRIKQITIHVLNPGVIPVEQDLLQLINAERSRRGFGTLTFNSKLHTSARKHAKDMADNNIYGYNGSDGSTPWDRMEWAGYMWTAAVENIAGESTMAIDVFNKWMANSELRANMLEPSFRDAGVGTAYNSSINSAYHSYWVMDIGSTQ